MDDHKHHDIDGDTNDFSVHISYIQSHMSYNVGRNNVNRIKFFGQMHWVAIAKYIFYWQLCSSEVLLRQGTEVFRLEFWTLPQSAHS